MYAAKQEIEYRFRLALIRITKIWESQAMMEMVKNTFITILHDISTNIVHMHKHDQNLRKSGNDGDG